MRVKVNYLCCNLYFITKAQKFDHLRNNYFIQKKILAVFPFVLISQRCLASPVSVLICNKLVFARNCAVFGKIIILE